MPTPTQTNQPWRLPTKPLQLERRQGCADRSVFGGISGLVGKWARLAAGHVQERELKAALAEVVGQARHYRSMDLPARQAFLLELERLGALVEQAAKTRPPRHPRKQELLSWGSPLSELPGIGPARAAKLADLGLATVSDLLQMYPLRYEDRRNPLSVRELEHRQPACLIVEVTGPGHVAYRGPIKMASVPATDGADPLTLLWFNQPYRATQMKEGMRLVVSGSVRLHKGEASLVVTEAEIIADEELHVRRLVPIYSTPPFSQVVTRKLVRAAVETCTEYPEERVPAHLIAQYGLITLARAYREIHFPTGEEALQRARARLAYDELFALQIRLARRRRRAKETHVDAGFDPAQTLPELLGVLPFELTEAQRRVMEEILADLRRPEAANRLIHGDVGAGKTIVAALPLLAAVRAGKQAALMAPTELLAQQHHQTLSTLLQPLGVQPKLLIGSLAGAEKRGLQEGLRRGTVSLVIGTHALFQQAVKFRNLAVAVIDEQHRFGVRQRALLAGKESRPNCFIMSATPIPRTLALTAYGDFDISILDELPPGRQPVHTAVLTPRQVKKAYRMISDVVTRGQQAYLVCPLIEGKEERRLAAAEDLFHTLKADVFPSLKLGLVHGKMDSAERERVMERFRAGELETLVATTVIEVGVDVPNATVMVVMNAERFGLAQLHQLRGRVARSQNQAYCLLVSGASTPEVIERLQVLEHTNDGFLVAEEDLRRRGPGEMAGLRQSGLPDVRMADLLADTQTLARAREDAFALIKSDPHLSTPPHAGLLAWLGPEGESGDWTL